jgi:hypothetical protein
MTWPRIALRSRRLAALAPTPASSRNAVVPAALASRKASEQEAEKR